MLRLRRSILTRLFSPPSAPPISPLHRLLSAPPISPPPLPYPRISPNPSFAVEDYLVASCGLPRAQALKASAKLSHLKSPTKPDAVLAFLAGIGLSRADVAAAVAKDPQLLCASVDRTLAPIATGLTQVGLSRAEIARLVRLAPASFRCRSSVTNLPYYLSLFGSGENILRVRRSNTYLLSANFQRLVKPKVTLLQEECGLDDYAIAKLCISLPRLLTTNVERIRTMVACVQGIGVCRDSGMFRVALRAVGYLSKEKIAIKVGYLKNTFRASQSFFISEMGLEPAYIARLPVIITFSLEGRLRPRYYVLKFLVENGLLDRARDYYSAVVLTEKAFMEKLICPHKEAAPYLAEHYAAACKGEIPTRFRFT